MADRTWNQIDSRVYDEPWSRCARRIWAHIIAICPNQYGVFDSPLGRISDFWADAHTAAEISSALEELTRAGCLVIKRNGQVWWIRKKWARESWRCKTRCHQKGVAAMLGRYPEILQDWEALYGPCNTPSSTECSASVGPRASDYLITDYLKSENTNTPPPSPPRGEPAPRVAGGATSRNTKEEPQWAIELATKAADLIDELVEKHNHPRGNLNNRKPECARGVRRLVEIDKVPKEDILPAISWAWTYWDGNFNWGHNLLAIGQWRKNEKFVNMWRKWKTIGQRQGRKDRLADGTPALRPISEVLADRSGIPLSKLPPDFKPPDFAPDSTDQ